MNEKNAIKTGAIIRVCVYSTIAIVLIAVLIMSLSSNLNIFRVFTNIGVSYNYPNSDKYLTGDASVDPSEVNTFNIDWIAGSVNIVAYDGDTIKITETYNTDLDEQDKLKYLVDEGTLYIKFRSPKKFPFINIDNIEKHLTVSIPKSLASGIHKLDIESVSATVDTNGLTVRECRLQSVSGKVTASFTDKTDNINAETVSGKLTIFADADKVDIESVSGEINFCGYAEELDAEAVSGKISLDLSNCPQKLDTESISGKILLTIPENDGFTAKYDTVSGDFDCEFNTKITDKRAVYKNGTANLSFETVSGSISILKK